MGIPALLEDGIKVLVYPGEYDLICNWLGKTLVERKAKGFYVYLPHKIKFYWKLFNYCSSTIWQVIQDGFMQWNGLARRNLSLHLQFHSWLMVQKQDC